jgi:predicted dehydrogenase
MQSLSRRELLQAAGATALSAAVPQAVHGATAPSALRVALIGTGGICGYDAPEIASHKDARVVAVCDPDRTRRDAFGTQYGVAESRRFADYRAVIQGLRGEVDAVYCGTPDHMHAPVALAALEAGLHAYVQKPLARGVGEVRTLARAAAKRPKLATQMGIQIHADTAYRSAVAWLQAGVIGKVVAVHSFCAKGWGGAQPPHAADPIPPELDWDRYCGVSPVQDFVADYYHPSNWRKWQAFGTGTLGDMACHIFDPVFGGVVPGMPDSVVSHLEGPPNAVNFSYNAHITWTFPDGPTLHWYHGDTRPPADVLPGHELPGAGSVLIGEKGRMLLPHWAMPTVFDPALKPVTTLPAPLPSISHHHEWVDTALGRRDGPCGAHFGYSGPLTETVLLGNIAAWWPGKVLHWDAKACRFTGDGSRDANRRRLPEYRKGINAPRI